MVGVGVLREAKIPYIRLKFIGSQEVFFDILDLREYITDGFQNAGGPYYIGDSM